MPLDEQSVFIRHVPCLKCKSDNNGSLYSDGHFYCHKCDTYMSSNQYQENEEPMIQNYPAKPIMDNTSGWVFDAIPDRKISADTAQKFKIKQNPERTKHQYSYTDSNGKTVASKIRTIKDKSFSISGQWPTASLFGSHLFTNGGKYITVTEGELDAAAVYQMNGGFPSVSIRNGTGAAVKDIKANLEYLEGFENVVICFDSDTSGKEAANKVAELFSPGKCSIVILSEKDPCDYLRANRSKDFINEWWNNKKTYQPDGIVCVADMWKTLTEEDNTVSVSYPWNGLQEMTYGMRLGELCTFAAGTGQGKSTTVREIAYDVVNKTDYKVGMIFLEESVKRTALALMGIHANKPFHLPDCDYTEEEFQNAFEFIGENRRVYLFDHYGSWDIDKLVARVRYMAKGLDCKFIFPDHISIIVSSGDNNDERRALDSIMTKLRMLVQELNIHLSVITHLKRIQGSGHEEGSVVSLSHLRGSAGIAQLSDMVLSLERDSQNDNVDVRNTTIVRVLKNRFSGETGPCGFLKYDKHTGRQTEIDALPDPDDDDQLRNEAPNVDAL